MAGLDLTPYLGRTVDLFAFQGFRPSGETLLTQALAAPGGSGVVIAGPEKVVQRFVMELLTESGSLPYLPDRGCRFMLDGRTGLWRTTADITQSFYSSLIDIKRNLLLEEATTAPNDERFGSAELLGVTLTNDMAGINVEVLTLAGTSRRFLAPLPFTI
jgi:hypothetical protein